MIVLYSILAIAEPAATTHDNEPLAVGCDLSTPIMPTAASRMLKSGAMLFPPVLILLLSSLAHPVGPAFEPSTRPPQSLVDCNDTLDALLGCEEDHLDADEFRQPPDDDELDIGGSETHSPPPSVIPKAEPLRSKEVQSSMPTWLQALYKDLCEQLRTEITNNMSHRPSCYDNGTFVLAPKAPFFASAHVLQLLPAIFYTPHYFIWLPHLFARIPCPACKSAGWR